MFHLNRYALLAIALFAIQTLITPNAQAQGMKKKVLFIGNSYTAVNNLPLLIANTAAANGDTLIHDNNTPGGYTFSNHFSNATSLAKIALGTWDLVVLQEQSQLPSFPDPQVESQVYPFARKLDSAIQAANGCTETMFYMTWGRKNGDAGNCAFAPWLCTYEGMDSMLRKRYMYMADTNKAVVSPVGYVWNKIRAQYPTINLYQSDESHPSLEGSYAAAITFYTCLYRKNPININYTAGINATTAQQIRQVVKQYVYDSLGKWYVTRFDPKAQFSNTQSGNLKVTFTNSSTLATTYKWSFGNGQTSTQANPVHTYTAPGTYTVKLIASKCGLSDSTTKQITVTGTSSVNNVVANNSWSIYPNPAQELIAIQVDENINAVYTIYTLDGRLVKSGAIKTGNTQVDIKMLNAGLYMLQLQLDNGAIDRKNFIKQ